MHPSPDDVLAVFGGDKTAAQSNMELPIREFSDMQIDDTSLPQQQQQQQQQQGGATSAIEGYVPRHSSAKLTPPPSRQLQHPQDSRSQSEGDRQFLLSELAAAATVDTVSITSNAAL